MTQQPEPWSPLNEDFETPEYDDRPDEELDDLDPWSPLNEDFETPEYDSDCPCQDEGDK